MHLLSHDRKPWPLHITHHIMYKSAKVCPVQYQMALASQDMTLAMLLCSSKGCHGTLRLSAYLGVKQPRVCRVKLLNRQVIHQVIQVLLCSLCNRPDSAQHCRCCSGHT